MFTGYSTVSSVVVLCLMLGYVYFSYLIRIVVFFNRYRCLDCRTVLSGKFFLQFLLLWRISLFFPLFFRSLRSDLFCNVDVCTFPWISTLRDILFCTVLPTGSAHRDAFIQNSYYSFARFVNTGAGKDLLSFRVPKTLRHFRNIATVNYVYYVTE